jgi:hypothetical protein
MVDVKDRLKRIDRQSSALGHLPERSLKTQRLAHPFYTISMVFINI